MLASLHWRLALNSADAEAQFHELQADAFHALSMLVGIGFVAWCLLGVIVWPTDEMMANVFDVAPLAIPLLAATFILRARSQNAARLVFVIGGLLAVSWSILALNTLQPVLLYAMLALIAAFVIHPLAGFGTIGGAIVAIEAIRLARPELIDPTAAALMVIFALLAVVGVWAISYHLFLALNWYAESYREAERQKRDAQEHRAKLVHALQQLDSAYYRLEHANRALRLAWSAADQAERSKMELAANISHELRTPLNLIAGYSEMMISSPESYHGVLLPAAYRGDLHAVYRSAQHLLALTDDVLALAQLEVGRLGLLREPVDLGQIIHDATSLIRDYLEAKGLELRLILPDRTPMLLADRLRLRQVLLNVLTNAARFTQQGYIQVELIDGRDEIRLQITDTGPGIPTEEIAHLFQQFVSRDLSQHDWHAGTGLGLAISKRFIELHGGDMGIESTIGLGTMVWLTLPLDPMITVENEYSSRRSLGGFSGSERVAVLAQVDERLRRVWERQADGYRIEGALDLADAALRATELSASAIIIDDDGDAGALPSVGIPVIRCPLPKAHRVANALGVFAYLVKPVSREVLLRTMDGIGRPVDRILIVDDDEQFARLLSRWIESTGRSIQIALAFNGAEAIEKARNAPPDLILLDRAMPDRQDLDVLAELAGDQRLGRAEIIIISAFAEADGDVPLGTAIQLIKPEGIRLAEMIQIVSAVINNLAPTRTLLQAGTPVPPEGAID